MNVIVNGSEIEIAELSTLETLVAQLDLSGKRIAIELNKEIIPKSLHGQTWLQGGDSVEVVQAIGGG